MNVTNSEADFVSSVEFRKGRAWEETVRALLQDMGYMVLRNRELPDLFVTDKTHAFWVECKAKARMNFHPATGFAPHDYTSYLMTQKLSKRPVVVVFNDPLEARIYGNTLDVLKDHIYAQDWGVIVFDHSRKTDAFLPLDEPSQWRYLIDGLFAKQEEK